jgi:hypothetical protein
MWYDKDNGFEKTFRRKKKGENNACSFCLHGKYLPLSHGAGLGPTACRKKGDLSLL